MKTAVLAVACLLMTATLIQGQRFLPFPGFAPYPYPRPPPFFGGGVPPPIFGPRFGQGRGLAYIGSLGLLGLGGPLGTLAGAAGLSGLLASDFARF